MTEKFKNIKGILSRDEMRQIKAGCGNTGGTRCFRSCTRDSDCDDDMGSCSKCKQGGTSNFCNS